MFVMVCYDVPAHRTEVYKRLLKEYLIHEQASVFMGDLPESEVIRMIDKISRKIRPRGQGSEVGVPEPSQRPGRQAEQGSARRTDASARGRLAWEELVSGMNRVGCA